MLNTIKKMLRIIDKNLTILAVLEQNMKGKQTLVIKAKPAPCFSHCPHYHTSLENSTSFICAKGKTEQLLDVLPSRKLNHLVHYFQKYPNRDHVQFLVTNINASYFQLTSRVFPQAKLVLDRFHVAQHLNRLFNTFLIKEVARLQQKNKQNLANKLKNRAKISHSIQKMTQL